MPDWMRPEDFSKIAVGIDRPEDVVVGKDGRVRETIDRSVIWQAYTPQMFRLGQLHRSLADALVSHANITDEASALEWAGHAPRLIEGRADNLKVTRPEDLRSLASLWHLKS
mgnify:CR=1 FL=1